MTLDEVIQLRPHHVLRYFQDWAFAAEEEIIKAHDVGYGKEYFNRLFTIKRQLLEENQPFIIVPAADDLCITCKRRQNRPQCEVPDSGHSLFWARRIGGNFKGINTPLKLVERILYIGILGRVQDYERLYYQLARKA